MLISTSRRCLRTASMCRAAARDLCGVKPISAWLLRQAYTASCIDSTAPPEAVFAREVNKLKELELKPREQITLEPYERDHAVVVGVFRPPPKKAT